MNYTVIYADRKTVSIQLGRDGSLTVRAPRGMSRREINEIVSSHQSWIDKKRAEQKPAAPLDFIYLLGAKYPVAETSSNRAGFDGASFYLPAGLDDAEKRAAIAGYFKLAGKEKMADKLSRWAKIMNLPAPPPPKITSAKTRWGSCGGKGGNHISFSFVLLMTDEECIDAVTVHELAHIRYKNHSKDFYALVRSYIPDYDEREKKLKEYGRIISAQGFM